MESSDYYYSREGQRFGPVPGDELKRLASSGQLQPNDLIWKEGMANWVQAARVKGLFPAAAVSAPVPAPAPAPAPIPAPAPAPVAAAEAEFTVAPPTASAPASIAASYIPPAQANPRQADAPDPALEMARQAKEAAMAASKDALKGFKVLIRNPVGGLREAFEALGPKAALGVGVVFAVVCLILELLGIWIGQEGLGSIGILFRELIFVVIPVGAAIGGCFAAQAAFRGAGGIEGAVFIAGASLLPLGAMTFVLGLLASHFVIVAAVLIFGLTTTTLMTYSGCTTVLRIPDVAATVVVPLIFIVDVVAFKLLILGATMGPGFGM